ncbi:MAG: hypothetical protein PVG53_10775 [Holophagae bacterium]|jgi:hypothetical protein
MNRTLDGDIQYSNGDLEISQCVWCRHRSSNGRRCRAYPDGIPDAILRNRHDHRLPYEGDSGLRFEPEIVEIEFVDVAEPNEDIPLSVELALAVARSGGRVTTDDDDDEDESDGDRLSATG